MPVRFEQPQPFNPYLSAAAGLRQRQIEEEERRLRQQEAMERQAQRAHERQMDAGYLDLRQQAMQPQPPPQPQQQGQPRPGFVGPQQQGQLPPMPPGPPMGGPQGFGQLPQQPRPQGGLPPLIDQQPLPRNMPPPQLQPFQPQPGTPLFQNQQAQLRQRQAAEQHQAEQPLSQADKMRIQRLQGGLSWADQMESSGRLGEQPAASFRAQVNKELGPLMRRKEFQEKKAKEQEAAMVREKGAQAGAAGAAGSIVQNQELSKWINANPVQRLNPHTGKMELHYFDPKTQTFKPPEFAKPEKPPADTSQQDFGKRYADLVKRLTKPADKDAGTPEAPPSSDDVMTAMREEDAARERYLAEQVMAKAKSDGQAASRRGDRQGYAEATKRYWDAAAKVPRPQVSPGLLGGLGGLGGNDRRGPGAAAPPSTPQSAAPPVSTQQPPAPPAVPPQTPPVAPPQQPGPSPAAPPEPVASAAQQLEAIKKRYGGDLRRASQQDRALAAKLLAVVEAGNKAASRPLTNRELNSPYAESGMMP